MWLLIHYFPFSFSLNKTKLRWNFTYWYRITTRKIQAWPNNVLSWWKLPGWQWWLDQVHCWMEGIGSWNLSLQTIHPNWSMIMLPLLNEAEYGSSFHLLPRYYYYYYYVITFFWIVILYRVKITCYVYQIRNCDFMNLEGWNAKMVFTYISVINFWYFILCIKQSKK